MPISSTVKARASALPSRDCTVAGAELKPCRLLYTNIQEYAIAYYNYDFIPEIVVLTVGAGSSRTPCRQDLIFRVCEAKSRFVGAQSKLSRCTRSGRRECARVAPSPDWPQHIEIQYNCYKEL